MFLRGWAGYLRYGNSADAFDKIRRYALIRLALFIAKRHQRGRGLGLRPRLRSGNALGLISPRWNRRRTRAEPGLAGSVRTPPVKDAGEPCAGEPHARFDGRGLETERHSVTVPVPDPTNLGLAVIRRVRRVICRGLHGVGESIRRRR